MCWSFNVLFSFCYMSINKGLLHSNLCDDQRESSGQPFKAHISRWVWIEITHPDIRVSLGVASSAEAAGYWISRIISLEPKQYLCLQKWPVEMLLNHYSYSQSQGCVKNSKKAYFKSGVSSRSLPIFPNFSIHCKNKP